MAERHLLIIGGGLAGLSAGCYARRSGFRTTIIEHNLALGGVCTTWRRGAYQIDGCIHWLTGGPFAKVYEELGIIPQVPLRTLDTWVTYRNVQHSWEFSVTRDLDALVARLVAISPTDAAELCRLREGAEQILAMQPPIAAPELFSLRSWKLFDPIVLASFGVEQEYKDVPSLLVVDGVTPFQLGGRTSESFYIRACNDDPCFAPPGHSVIQAMIPTDYAWWATRGDRYNAEKDAAAATVLVQLAPYFPALRESVRAIDVATPLTYWSMARSWRGAYEGYMPNADSLFSHVSKTLRGISGFYMAGQWVQPGGGVPTAVLSGRQAVELLCADEALPFVAR